MSAQCKRTAKPQVEIGDVTSSLEIRAGGHPVARIAFHSAAAAEAAGGAMLRALGAWIEEHTVLNTIAGVRPLPPVAIPRAGGVLAHTPTGSPFQQAAPRNRKEGMA